MTNPRALGCLLFGVALIGFGLWSGIEATSEYHVRFASSGSTCASHDALVLDEDDGEPLSCNWKDTGTKPFTAQERDQLVTLARELGRDGISLTDEDQIFALNARIAASHGDPDRSKEQTGSPGHFAFLVGVPIAVAGLVWVLRSRDPLTFD
jgi:hypothetical protein